MIDAADLHDQWSQLCAAYAVELPGKLDSMEQAWDAAQAGDANAWSEMLSQAHKLASSAALFGFPKISQVATPLEGVIGSIIADAAPNDGVKKRIANMVAELRSSAVFEDPSPLANGRASPLAKHEAELAIANGEVFLVENDAEFAASVSQHLLIHGYRVRVLANPDALAKALKQTTPIAVISDLVFPGRDATVDSAVRVLRTQLPVGIPVAFLSSRSDAEARMAAVRAGGRAFLTKPVDLAELVNRLDSWLKLAAHEPIRALIVEGDFALAQAYSLTLQAAGILTMTASEPSQVLVALEELLPDVILVDLYLPSCTGTEIAQMVQQFNAHVGVPILFLSTESDLRRQLKARTPGADVFVAKPVDPDRLVATVQGRAHRYRRIRTLMECDSLTGLLNHARLQTRLGQEIIAAQRRGTPMALAMIDVDHFKGVNDTYGHLAGDRVLQSLSRLLQQRLRTTDTVGRHGGEEFGVILSDVDPENAIRVIDGLRRDFAALTHRSGDQVFQVSFSAGVAAFPGPDSVESLINIADQALYRAKHAGRNRVVLAEPQSAPGTE